VNVSSFLFLFAFVQYTVVVEKKMSAGELLQETLCVIWCPLIMSSMHVVQSETMLVYLAADGVVP
jgi:hypothetical protein